MPWAMVATYAAPRIATSFLGVSWIRRLDFWETFWFVLAVKLRTAFNLRCILPVKRVSFNKEFWKETARGICLWDFWWIFQFVPRYKTSQLLLIIVKGREVPYRRHVMIWQIVSITMYAFLLKKNGTCCLRCCSKKSVGYKGTHLYYSKKDNHPWTGGISMLYGTKTTHQANVNYACRDLYKKQQVSRILPRTKSWHEAMPLKPALSTSTRGISEF
jgi:hypothetical protein